jgi:hypothetical protein
MNDPANSMAQRMKSSAIDMRKPYIAMMLPYTLFVKIPLLPGAGRIEKTICANCGPVAQVSSAKIKKKH